MNWPSGDPNQPQYPPYSQPPFSPPPPPPMPYQQPYGQGPGHPPPKKSRKGLIIALVAVGVVLLLGLIAAVAFVFFVAKEAKDKVIATDLAVGDCLTDIPTGELVSLVPKVACSQPHSGEVFAVLTMPDGAFPGMATINEWQNKCPSQLESYSPDAMADESVSVFVLYPTDETWATGDRAVTCIATTDDKRTGSVKG